MTARFDIDHQVASWLEAERPPVAPDGLLEAVQAGVNRTNRRPGWLVADRWTWRHGAGIRTTVRVALLLAVVASLVAILVVVAGLLGSPPPAPPFGPTRAGLIAVDTAEGIVLVRADGTERRLLVPADGQSVSPTWSRDGLHLAYWHRQGETGPWDLVVVDGAGHGRMVLTEGVSLLLREQDINQPSNLSWSPDSRRVAFAADVGGPGGGSSIFVATLGRSGVAQITDPALFGIDPAWSPDGGLIAFRSEVTGTLRLAQPDGAGERRLSDLVGANLWLDWSPDGSRLAATVGVEGEDFDADIYVVSADGTETRDVSRDPTYEMSPTWSPDGKRLAWARIPADGSARAHVVVADADGPNVLEIRVPADLAPPVWSPDGTRLYSYRLGTDGAFSALVVLDPNGVAPPLQLPAEGNIGNGNWQRLP
jgi:Tol biopolymer transport system component